MKQSVVILASRVPTLLPRVVRILYWQGVDPVQLHWEATDLGGVEISLVVACDPWRFRRLLQHWERIIGVLSVTARPLADGPADTPAEELAPAAR